MLNVNPKIPEQAASVVVRSNDMLRVTIGDGKYTVIQDASGKLFALRYGRPWRDCCGDGLIYALAAEVEELRERLADIEIL